MQGGRVLTAIHFLVASLRSMDLIVVGGLIRAPVEIRRACADRPHHHDPLDLVDRLSTLPPGSPDPIRPSRRVGIGTAIRLVANIARPRRSAIRLDRSRESSSAASAVAVGVISRGDFIGFSVRPILQGDLRAAPPVEHPLTSRSFLHFYIPLAMTPLLMLLSVPIGSAAVSRMPRALDSLAVWPVINGLTFGLRSVGIAYNEVVVALLDRPRPIAATQVRRDPRLLDLRDAPRRRGNAPRPALFRTCLGPHTPARRSRARRNSHFPARPGSRCRPELVPGTDPAQPQDPRDHRVGRDLPPGHDRRPPGGHRVRWVSGNLYGHGGDGDRRTRAGRLAPPPEPAALRDFRRQAESLHIPIGSGFQRGVGENAREHLIAPGAPCLGVVAILLTLGQVPAGADQGDIPITRSTKRDPRPPSGHGAGVEGRAAAGPLPPPRAVARGHHSVVVTPTGSPLARRIRDENLPLREILYHGAGDPIALFLLVKRSRRPRPILHAHTAHAHNLGFLALRLPGIPKDHSRPSSSTAGSISRLPPTS